MCAESIKHTNTHTHIENTLKFIKIHDEVGINRYPMFLDEKINIMKLYKDIKSSQINLQI